LSHFLGYAATLVVTLSVGISLALLISRLPAHKDPPGQLLRSAGALWICNMLVFACWYWRLDAGGPHQRALRRSHDDGHSYFRRCYWTQSSASRWARTNGTRGLSITCFWPSTPALPFHLQTFLCFRGGPKS